MNIPRDIAEKLAEQTANAKPCACGERPVARPQERQGDWEMTVNELTNEATLKCDFKCGVCDKIHGFAERFMTGIQENEGGR